jgi:hypothetical protein
MPATQSPINFFGACFIQFCPSTAEGGKLIPVPTHLMVVINLTDGEKMDAPYETLDNMKCLKENPSCN